jgi:putative FmdB family regulatory protein
MPTHSYECKSCSSPFDTESSVTDTKREAQVSCPWCGSSKVEKLRQGFSPVGKGTGGGCCGPSSGCCGPAPKRKS